jgi:hypothetical protein
VRILVIGVTSEVPIAEMEMKSGQTACDDLNTQVYFCGYFEERYSLLTSIGGTKMNRFPQPGDLVSPDSL